MAVHRSTNAAAVVLRQALARRVMFRNKTAAAYYEAGRVIALSELGDPERELLPRPADGTASAAIAALISSSS
jgi:hypothetical protein